MSYMSKRLFNYRKEQRNSLIAFCLWMALFVILTIGQILKWIFG